MVCIFLTHQVVIKLHSRLVKLLNINESAGSLCRYYRKPSHYPLTQKGNKNSYAFVCVNLKQFLDHDRSLMNIKSEFRISCIRQDVLRRKDGFSTHSLRFRWTVRHCDLISRKFVNKIPRSFRLSCFG